VKGEGGLGFTIIFVGLVCMYLLPHVCIKIFLIYLMCETKLDSLLTDIKKIPSPPPPSLIMKTSEWEDMSLLMVSMLALSVLDPWDRAPVWSN
jgi:hypothetical protein